MHHEYLLWATSASGIVSSRKAYETLETYGDTILKLSATMFAYEMKKDNPKAGEGDVEYSKVCFVTNTHLFRVGNNMKLQRFAKAFRDTDYKGFVLPCIEDQPQYIFNKCTGKNVADLVESQICALYLSSNLKSTLQWISDIKLVPLEKANIL